MMNENIKYATIRRRFFASLLDCFIYCVIGLIISISLSFLLFTIFGPLDNSIYYFLIGVIIGLMYILMNSVLFTASKKFQGTLGQYLLKIKIIDTNNNRLTLKKSFIRYLCSYVYCIPTILLDLLIKPMLPDNKYISLIFSIIYLIFSIIGMGLFFYYSYKAAMHDPKKQLLHDRLADTYVVYR